MPEQIAGGNGLASMTRKGSVDRARFVPRFAGLSLLALAWTAAFPGNDVSWASGLADAEPRSLSDASQGPGSLLLLAQDTTNEASEDGAQESAPEAGTEETPEPQTDNAGESAGEDDLERPLPQIITDLEEISFPARKMRQLILEAARSGDVEKLRPYLGYGDDVTMLSLGGHEEDPIEFLKSLSGDHKGHEILAIMTEILEAPPVKTETVPGDVVYVWPYFYAYPFDKLTPEQRVDMYRIITHGDYEEMIQFGSYIFYRLGITPEGRWRFFVAGD